VLQKGGLLDETIAIAVVDDDELVRTSLGGLLRSFGLCTEMFESADALLAAGADRFACIVSDLQMPGTSGVELWRILVAKPQPVPVIIVTAFPERATDARRSSDNLQVLEKPIDSQKLITSIEAVLGRQVG
jgi:FixJ family two-component response regulator